MQADLKQGSDARILEKRRGVWKRWSGNAIDSNGFPSRCELKILIEIFLQIKIDDGAVTGFQRDLIPARLIAGFAWSRQYPDFA